MKEKLELLMASLAELSSSLDVIPSEEAFNVAHGNWSFPGVSKFDLRSYVDSVIEVVAQGNCPEVDGCEGYIDSFIRRIDILKSGTVPQMWGNPAAAVSGFMETLRAIKEFFIVESLDVKRKDEAAKNLRKIATQVRAMEARLNDLEPRSQQLSAMIKDIEAAHETANELPADLEQLKEDRRTIKRLLSEAVVDVSKVSDFRVEADAVDIKLKDSFDEAVAVLAKCEEAYSSSTSVGLAAAFSERSVDLNGSIKAWVLGLLVALVAGAILGSHQLNSIAALAAKPDVSGDLIAVNILLAVLSVGGPIWFAWLSTKQIGQRFRLSEDYAFKASISRAYEGYRREAAKIDPVLEARLLASALTRLDELPIRLVESASHGSPWHELMNSEVIKDAIRSVPGFVEKVKDMAGSSVNVPAAKATEKVTD